VKDDKNMRKAVLFASSPTSMIVDRFLVNVVVVATTSHGTWSNPSLSRYRLYVRALPAQPDPKFA